MLESQLKRFQHFRSFQGSLTAKRLKERLSAAQVVGCCWQHGVRQSTQAETESNEIECVVRPELLQQLQSNFLCLIQMVTPEHKDNSAGKLLSRGCCRRSRQQQERARFTIAFRFIEQSMFDTRSAHAIIQHEITVGDFMIRAKSNTDATCPFFRQCFNIVRRRIKATQWNTGIQLHVDLNSITTVKIGTNTLQSCIVIAVRHFRCHRCTQ